jgi:hypothetical protein
MPTPYERRVARLRNDEKFGPKLARLSKGEQNRVLGLVRDNRGREARTTLTELDTARRERVRVASATRRRTEREKRTFSRIVRTKGIPKGDIVKLKKVRTRVALMSNDDMTRMTRMDDAHFDAFVSEQARIPVPPGQINPFWYH